MWYIGENRYPQVATVWSVEDKENYALVKISTSRKDKKTDSYVNSSWLAKFVSNAYNDDIVNMPQKTRIVIKAGGISREEYQDKEGNRAWPKNPQIVVFAWEYPESKGESQGNMDKPPVVEDSDSDELPF